MVSQKLSYGVYVIVENADLYQEVLGGLSGVAELKLVGSSGGVPDRTFPVDLLIFAATAENGARRGLEALRRSPGWALTPVLVVLPRSPHRLTPPECDHLLTLPLSGFEFRAALKALTPIRACLERYPPISAALDEKAAREITLLRFLHSRDLSQVMPGRDETSPYGYRLAWADALLRVAPGQGLMEMNRLAREGLLEAEVVDYVPLCPTCEDFRLACRQVCPGCQSPRWRRTPTIQHYSCGHVAPQTAFVRRDRYVCPKCSKELRHIGVDYAKPGEVLLCEVCGGTFQEPELSCLCIRCGAVFPPDRTRPLAIQRFSLSPQGVEAALLGLHTRLGLEEVLHHFLNIYSFPFFQAYLDLELKRCDRYRRQASLIRLAIRNLEELEGQLGVGGKMLLVKELQEIIGSHTRQTDLVTVSPHREILLLLPETEAAQAQTVVDRLVQRSREVLSFPLDFSCQILPLPGSGEAEALKHALLTGP
ncbi:MAG: hypothetical protein K6T55_02765 [Syntrophobacterales bacterium]|nr:hypothetical protein [Syntrophobacterales bacterium]